MEEGIYTLIPYTQKQRRKEKEIKTANENSI